MEAPGQRVVHAVCTHDCPDSCGVLVTVDQLTGRATRVAGDPTHPVTRGFLCGKVARYLDRVYSPERLLYPMRRRPGIPKGPLPQGQEAEAFERISWDEALTLAADRLFRTIREHGPESVLPYSYAGTIGQLGYGAMDRRLFHALASSQLDRAICASAGTAALNAVYGTRLGVAPQDFAHAGLVLAWGANLHGNSIHLWPFVEQARRRGARLVVIDPFRTRTAALADTWLPIRPGTDTLLALSLMHVLFRDGLHNEPYLNACAPDWRSLRDHALLPEHSPANAARITGLPANAIEDLAQHLGQTARNPLGPAVIRMNYGIQRSENGGEAARAVSMLPLITGAWQRPGGGLLLSTSGAFPFNTAAVQRPDLLRGRSPRTVNMNRLGDALTELSDPPVKALVVYNCNAAAVAPDSTRVLAGLRRPDLFTLVHEQFFTDTTDYADLVLPATTFLEHTELMGAYGHYQVQLSSAAIAPLGEARPNLWLFAELGQRLAPMLGFDPSPFHETEADLIAEALRSTHPHLAGITPARLAETPTLPLNLPLTPAGDFLPFSTPAHFPHGHAELHPLPRWIPPTESRHTPEASAFPLEFLPRKADNYMNTTFANLPQHQKMEQKSAGVLDIHPVDAAARHILPGDSVEVFNARGRIRLLARPGASVPPGVVAARLDWQKLSPGGHNVNALTSQRLTDLGDGATFYSTLVEVRKLPTSDDEPLTSPSPDTAPHPRPRSTPPGTHPAPAAAPRPSPESHRGTPAG